MTDFSKTINLPKTVFAMKANLSETENLRTDFWKEKKVYQTLKKKVRMKKNISSRWSTLCQWRPPFRPCIK